MSEYFGKKRWMLRQELHKGLSILSLEYQNLFTFSTCNSNLFYNIFFELCIYSYKYYYTKDLCSCIFFSKHVDRKIHKICYKITSMYPHIILAIHTQILQKCYLLDHKMMLPWYARGRNWISLKSQVLGPGKKCEQSRRHVWTEFKNKKNIFVKKKNNCLL